MIAALFLLFLLAASLVVLGFAAEQVPPQPQHRAVHRPRHSLAGGH